MPRPDPGCGTDGSDPDEGSVVNNTSGFIGPFGDCRLAYGPTLNYQTAREHLGFYGNVAIILTDQLDFELQAVYSRLQTENRTSPSSPGGNSALLPVIVGENPFNPFRAVDGNGNEIFAQDADADGIPDRDGSDVVILDPVGIAFNEDVRITGWRPFGMSVTPG